MNVAAVGDTARTHSLNMLLRTHFLFSYYSRTIAERRPPSYYLVASCCFAP